MNELVWMRDSMWKRIIIILGCVMLLFSGCGQEKYQRIHFDNEYLSITVENHIDTNTLIVNNGEEKFKEEFPIYKITEKKVSQQEFENMLQELKLIDDPTYEYDEFVLEGNFVSCDLALVTDFSRGFFNMNDEELEKLAWEIFEKLSFMEGDFEYLGIKEEIKVHDKTGTHIARVGVSFRRVLDGTRVIGEDNCTLYFDGSGLVALWIKLFDYEKCGMMSIVPLENAITQIKTPDDFSIDTDDPYGVNIASVLEIEQTELLYVNQHFQGCTILQPIYKFTGNAIMEGGEKVGFSAKVIAIPEEYTYEKVE